MSAPRIAFVDHSYHETSGASAFLRDLLERHCSVDVYWDEKWRGGPAADMEKVVEGGYDLVLFFQVIDRSRRELRLLRGRRLVFVPMYDDVPRRTSFLWRRLSRHGDIRFLNFSSTVHGKLARLGLPTRHFRFYPSLDGLPAPRENAGELRGFFWQRTSRVTWKHIRLLVGESPFRSFTVHSAVDPGFRFLPPPGKDRDRFGIEITRWFPDRRDYCRKLDEATVFFAPRRREGIGMSFLEAMAMGKCVVAHGAPTMSEYITHGETGLLFNASFPRPCDFSDFSAVGARAREAAEQGRRRWLSSEDALLSFILR